MGARLPRGCGEILVQENLFAQLLFLGQGSASPGYPTVLQGRQFLLTGCQSCHQDENYGRHDAKCDGPHALCPPASRRLFDLLLLTGYAHQRPLSRIPRSRHKSSVLPRTVRSFGPPEVAAGGTHFRPSGGAPWGRMSAQWPRSRVIKIGRRERVRRVAAIAAIAASMVVFTGVLIPFLSSTTPYTPAQKPPEQPERASVHGGGRDSDYAWLRILNEWEATGFVPGVSGLFPGVPGPASHSPHWMDQAMEVGPRSLPTLWNRGGEQSSRDGRMGSSPLVLFGDSR